MKVTFEQNIQRMIDADASREEIMLRLDHMASIAEISARRYERGPKAKRYLGEEERTKVARIGNILFFLHHGSYSDNASDSDIALCKLLAEHLRKST
jgi:hypothetical protein